MSSAERDMAPQQLAVGSPVRFAGGTFAGSEGKVTALTPQKARVHSPQLGKEVCVMQSSLELLTAGMGGLSLSSGSAANGRIASPDTAAAAAGGDAGDKPPRRVPPPKATPLRAPASFAVPASPGASGLGSHRVEKTVLRDLLAKPAETTFLGRLLDDRLRLIEVTLPLPEGGSLPQPVLERGRGRRRWRGRG
jgi:hypothetical protein